MFFFQDSTGTGQQLRRDSRSAVHAGVGHDQIPAQARAADTGSVSTGSVSTGSVSTGSVSTGSVSTGEPFREISDGIAITPSVSVVLPVKNEAANLPHVFASLPGWIDEVVLVDGWSTDDTIAVARQLRPDVRVVLQGGVGKGDALVAGFEACTGDIIVAIDGDGSTDGQEIVRFVGALMTGADFAKGSRFSSAGRSDDITVIRRYGNKVLNVAVNKMFGTSFSDLCYGYNAFWSRHLGKLELDSPGFEVETLMSIRAARAGLRIHEVPSHERPRLHGSSNLSAVTDGLRILRLIVREKQASIVRAARKPKPFMAPGRLDGSNPGRSASSEPGRPVPARRDREHLAGEARAAGRAAARQAASRVMGAPRARGPVPGERYAANGRPAAGTVDQAVSQ